jgi:hypothetical protein
MKRLPSLNGQLMILRNELRTFKILDKALNNIPRLSLRWRGAYKYKIKLLKPLNKTKQTQNHLLKEHLKEYLKLILSKVKLQAEMVMLIKAYLFSNMG